MPMFEIWRRKWVVCVLLLIESDSTHSNPNSVVDLEKKMSCLDLSMTFTATVGICRG
ncbi:hypothetical protein MtrunA17_Chr3g0120491 [Medicago truncatula]|uniref:Transmembrane protein n=1 Tax=Medicago truncatula TaxID=3880 RepID=A0A396IX91_MEDTR|nr:hypothetical protein MtrunA17_Chr3g0120491 [Medicago truncatula]